MKSFITQQIKLFFYIVLILLILACLNNGQRLLKKNQLKRVESINRRAKQKLSLETEAIKSLGVRQMQNTKNQQQRSIQQEVTVSVGTAATGPYGAPPDEAETPPTEDLKSGKVVPLLYQGITPGYITIPSKPKSHFFYIYAPSRDPNPDSPLLLWLNGGPGCSSLGGYFTELGPYWLQKDGKLIENEHAWNSNASVIFLEQPLFTGFSFTDDPQGESPTNSTSSAYDVYEFLLEFYKLHPELTKKRFYVTGESYAGTYIPPIGYTIFNQNAISDNFKIPLAGLAIGNGITNKEIQDATFGEFIFQHGLINLEELYEANKCLYVSKVALEAANTNYNDTSKYYAKLASFSNINDECGFEAAYAYIPNLNYYDVRVPCAEDPSGQGLCQDGTILIDFLNSAAVKKELKVMNNTQKNIEWVQCSNVVGELYGGDNALEYDQFLPPLLDAGIDVLLYVGDQDLICNWVGVRRLGRSLKWSGKDKFNSVIPKEYLVDGVDAGEITNYKTLSYLKVYGAGHEVPQYQPKVSLSFLNQFIYKKPIEST